MVIKTYSLNNAATKYLANCFLLGLYSLKPVALFANSMEKCMDIEHVGSD